MDGVLKGRTEIDTPATDRHNDAAERPIGRVLEEIADGGQYVGGGTAAAMAGALAGATAALVAGLSLPRKANREHAAQIQADIDELGRLQRQLLEAAREDEAALAALMQRYKDRDADEQAMLAAVLRAARSTLAIARDAAEVAVIAARQATIASKFTVSDVGAAASIARGAVIAALVTAETNVVLLDAYPAAQAETAALRDGILDADQKSRSACEAALSVTRERISS